MLIAPTHHEHHAATHAVVTAHIIQWHLSSLSNLELTESAHAIAHTLDHPMAPDSCHCAAAAESYDFNFIKTKPVPKAAGFFRGVANFIDTLLDKQPLRQAPAKPRYTPAGQRRHTAQPAARSGSAAIVHSPSGVSCAHSALPLSEHFGVVDSWPTPSAVAWEEI